jgi:membrane protease subunit HflC
MKNKSIFLIPLAIIAFVIYSAAYMVDETEQVVVTQFGRIVGEPKTDPGLKFKVPFIQKANYFNKNLLVENCGSDQIFPDREQPI